MYVVKKDVDIDGFQRISRDFYGDLNEISYFTRPNALNAFPLYTVTFLVRLSTQLPLLLQQWVRS
jgi:hypothetical protein